MAGYRNAHGRVVGKISALTLNHHGNRDATNRTFLNTLDPKVVVMQSWCTDHPGAEVGHRLISSNIGTQQRDVYMTYYNDETTIGTGPWFPRKLKAKQGHIVIRAYADGSFSVFVLDDTKINPVVMKREDYK